MSQLLVMRTQKLIILFSEYFYIGHIFCNGMLETNNNEHHYKDYIWIGPVF